MKAALSRANAAKYLDVSQRHFDRQVEAGRIRGSRVGDRKIVFMLEELDRFLKECMEPVAK